MPFPVSELLLGICSYLKSVLRYKFVILDIYHPGALCIRKQECVDPLFCETKRGSEQRILGNTVLECSI
jgi:hypothetical protein